MFLKIIRRKDGVYLFKNGYRFMEKDEVIRRCPLEWIASIDTKAAEYIENYKASAERATK